MQVDEIRALGARLVSEEVILYPVRHHSPACALHLLQLFARVQPSVVLVEGPRSFTPLIPMLAHADAKAPLAVYTYAVQRMNKEGEEHRYAAYYPFCDYSPEMVALREAQRLGIPAHFIDLDFSEQCLIEQKTVDVESQSLLDERHYKRSQYLQRLAQSLGCRDHEELWEHLFEASAAELTLDAHIAQVAVYCHLARCDSTPEALAADGTLKREAEMAWHIREAIRQRALGAGPVLAVLGGFHAVEMPALLAQEAERPAISRAEVTDEASALIRYSFDRLDRLNGYSAGMTSPAWHQRLWERLAKRAKAGFSGASSVRQETALSVLFDIAETLRGKYGVPLPAPELSAAYEQTLRLAALRGRTAPVRDDVLDAVVSCFIKGDIDADGALVRAVAQQTLGGNAQGAVPAGAGRPPLVKDFESRARRQRLKIDAPDPRRLMLDIYRRADHRITSRLLHGLVLLGVPFAVRTAGPDFVTGTGLDRLQEHWEYQYSPLTEGALIEASVYGVTVPRATANRFLMLLDQKQAKGEGRDARFAAASLAQACVLGLHDHLPRVLALLRTAIGEDANFDAVASAAMSVGLLWESREPLEARDVDELPEVLQSAYERAVYLGASLQGAPGDGISVIEALTQLRELLRSAAGRALDESLYWGMVRRLQRHHDLPLIRGTATGLLYAAGYLSEQALGELVHGHLDGLLQPGEAVAFLRGLLHTAREAAWQQPAILGVLNDLLSQWDESAFVASLPELRLAFAGMTPKETDRIAEAVAQLHGVETLGKLVSYDLSAEQLQENLLLSRTVQEIIAAEGLGAWMTA
jgi:hypothetical protein